MHNVVDARSRRDEKSNSIDVAEKRKMFADCSCVYQFTDRCPYSLTKHLVDEKRMPQSTKKLFNRLSHFREKFYTVGLMSPSSEFEHKEPSKVRFVILQYAITGILEH